MTIFLATVKHGRAGNNVFQLVDAYHLSKLQPIIELEAFAIEELQLPHIGDPNRVNRIQRRDRAFSPSHAVELIQRNSKETHDSVIYLDYLNISPELAKKERFFLRTLFESQLSQEPEAVKTVVHIRAGDIWRTYRNIRRPIHPDYSPLPLDYYKLVKERCENEIEVISEYGGPNWYRDALRKTINPVRESVARPLAEDFTSFLNCSNLVLSISTLSWMASLIGECKTIHYPKLGLFDPQRRGDLRFSPPKPAIVYEFEEHNWVGGNKFDKEWLLDSRVKAINP